MNRLLCIMKSLFHPSPLSTALLALWGYGFALAVAALHVENPVLQIASYTASAYALVITITGLPYLQTAIQRLRQRMAAHPLVKRFRATAMGEKYLTDHRFRVEVSLWFGFAVNLLYIAMKLLSGLYYRSVWFIALAVYYALLACMRLMLARPLNAQDETAEPRRCRLCGVTLLLMNQALAGVVALIVRQNRSFAYPGVLIYGMAAYAFYAVIAATVHLVKARSEKSLILSAAKTISLVAALVSLLSLETALLERFGANDAPMFRRVMTGATGGAVCTFVIFAAVMMIVRANRDLRRIQTGRMRA